MAFAPASIVSRMVSSVGPPVAIIGTVGKESRIIFTILGVSLAAETLNIFVPASILAATSTSSFTTETTTGTSTISEIRFTISFFVGALSTTPATPRVSAFVARLTARSPFVSPPPTPANTGISEALTIVCVMSG